MWSQVVVVVVVVVVVMVVVVVVVVVVLVVVVVGTQTRTIYQILRKARSLAHYELQGHRCLRN